MDAIHADIEAFLERRNEAIRRRDIDRLMSFFAPDLVYFDLVPGLRYIGAAAMRERFLDWFGRWQSGIGQEVHDLMVTASGDVAAAHMLIRTSGTLTTGQQVGYWVRASDVLRRSAQTWVITHEHISLPVDLQTRRAMMDLVP